ncbi:MAG: ComEA family DNA-binding protein [Candidatus Woesebacteria bacterium]|nr:ComEA family DNA-binding protein [Candidatus Woesebacteria bacterium]
MPNWEEIFLKFRYPLLILLVGLILILSGVFIVKSGLIPSSTKVEVLQATTSGQAGGEITVEVAGEVMRPGVYKLPVGSRVEDLLIISGGFSVGADRVWSDKYLNRAAKLTDGQKVFIPSVNQQSSVLSAKNVGGDQTVSSTFSSDSNRLINVNTASLGDLDSLPGIGPVYGKSIIEHRPYSNVEELLSKGALKPSVYQKVKDLVSVY